MSILATKKALFNNGILNAETVAGNQANINLNSPNIQLRYGSRITGRLCLSSPTIVRVRVIK